MWLCTSTGTYLTHEAKGAEDAPDADTAIINAEGNHVHAEEKKEYFIQTSVALNFMKTFDSRHAILNCLSVTT